MRRTLQGGYAGAILMIVGFIFLLLLAGYFSLANNKNKSKQPTTPSPVISSENQATNTAECGLYLSAPEKNAVVRFPFTVSGKIISGCGWKAIGGVVGTMYIESLEGERLTEEYSLSTYASGNDTTQFFQNFFVAYSEQPTTAYGRLVIKSSATPIKKITQQVNLAGARIPYGICGISVASPSQNVRIFSPLKITGNAYGCGWQAVGGSFGSVALFSDSGNQLSPFVQLTQTGSYNGDTWFKTELPFQQGQGNSLGYLLFVKIGSMQNDTLSTYRVPVIY